MLGWFKKKFGKKEDPSSAESAPLEVVKEEVAEEIVTPDLAVEQEATPILPAAVETVTETDDISRTTDETSIDSTASVETSIADSSEQDRFTNTAPPAESPEPREPELITEPTDDIPTEPDTPRPQTPILIADEEAETKDSEKTQNKKESLFSRLTNRLGKTRESFTYQMDALFLGKKEIDTNLLDSLEEILITADLGVETAEDLIAHARKVVKRKALSDPNALKDILKEQIKKLIVANDADATLVMPKSGPFVIMVIGVNGVGKTTTIGKIAHKFKQSGHSVMLVAADTFRAAAVSQLQIWGERNDVPVISHHEGADPSSVVFDALSSAVASNVDVVIVDTAGRMHTKENLMEELKKIKRVIGKKMRGAPHEIMLVIDATTGQNGISQARLFDAAVDITGLTLTKLDGTSKGGIVANICRDIKVPIRFIGIGEQMDDLRDFNATDFVDALFQSEK